MDRVAVAARAGVDADVGALGGGEAGQDAVVEVEEGLGEGGAGPGVAGVVLGGEAACDDAVSCGDLFDLSSFLFFSFFGILMDRRKGEVVLPSVKSIETLFAPPPPQKHPLISLPHSFTRCLHECLPRIPLHGPIQRIQQIQHTRRNDRLLHPMAFVWHTDTAFLKFSYAYVLLIPQQTALEPWQLPTMAVCRRRSPDSYISHQHQPSRNRTHHRDRSPALSDVAQRGRHKRGERGGAERKRNIKRTKYCPSAAKIIRQPFPNPTYR